MEHYDQHLPDGSIRRVFHDGRSVTIQAPRGDPDPRDAEAVFVRLHWPNRAERWTRLGAARRPGPLAPLVPLDQRHAWRDLQPQEHVRPDDEVLDDGTWRPAPAPVVGHPAGQDRRVRRAARLADGGHRLLDAGELVQPGDHFFNGKRWRPVRASVGHVVRRDRQHRRPLGAPAEAPDELDATRATEAELAVELGPLP